MSVRAKFKVRSKTQTKSGDAVYTSVRMEPVYGGSEENKKFFHATPSGQLELNGLNESAAGQLELDQEYYIDFTPANNS